MKFLSDWVLSDSKFLSVEDVRDICFEYAKTHLAYDEPIPDFGSRFPGRLESVLGVPRQTFQGVLVYSALAAQGAVLFYHLIKAHPFLNGNKRIACVSLLTFYFLNGKWLRFDTEALYNIALLVATSSPESREEIISTLVTAFEKSEVDRSILDKV